MGDIRITIPDDLHRNVKMHAAERGLALRDLVIEALRDYLKKEVK